MHLITALSAVLTWCMYCSRVWKLVVKRCFHQLPPCDAHDARIVVVCIMHVSPFRNMLGLMLHAQGWENTLVLDQPNAITVIHDYICKHHVKDPNNTILQMFIPTVQHYDVENLSSTWDVSRRWETDIRLRKDMQYWCRSSALIYHFIKTPGYWKVHKNRYSDHWRNISFNYEEGNEPAIVADR